MVLRFGGFTQWAFRYFVEYLICGPIPVVYTGHTLSLASVACPTLWHRHFSTGHLLSNCIFIECRPVSVAVYPGTVFRSCLHILGTMVTSLSSLLVASGMSIGTTGVIIGTLYAFHASGGV
jgi:hypothetical protein